jgi:hypothetical protein
MNVNVIKLVRWGEKMVMTLALRLLFPHTTLESVLNFAVDFNFQLLFIFYQIKLKSTA